LLLLPVLLGIEWGWTGGTAPLDLGPGTPSAEACGECHQAEHDAWAASRHRRSWTNDLMLVGYAAETQDFCVHCHAPDPAQKAEIRANRRFYRSLDPRSGIAPGSVARAPEPHADQGITCAACHWRDGEILAPSRSFAAPHAVTEAPDLATGEMCVGCHDFDMPESTDGRLQLTSVPMQSTGAEWRAWVRAGGDRGCPDCHMPGGDHLVRGAHDRDWLRDSVSVRAERSGDVLHFVVESVGVGHDWPTGDLFRHATLEVDDGHGYEVIDRIGRRFELTHDAADGTVGKRLAEHTSLRPGEPRIVRWTDPGRPVAWRLRWHDASENDEARGLLDLDDIVVTLHQGRLP
jgi:hypothetical protein